jgi:PEP-CTERM motif
MLEVRNCFLSVAIVACVTLTGMNVRAELVAPPGLSAVTPVGELLLTFDDMGNGTIAVAGGPTMSLPGSLLDDPADPACPSTCSPVLTYLLPESVVSGDVAILTPDGTEVADWLRFTDAAGTISGADTGVGGRMIFYFEAPFPSNIGLENLIVGPSEVVTDGMATFDYQPAGVPYPQNNEYIGSTIVAVVPEPASLLLLGSYVAAIGLVLRYRRLGRRGPIACTAEYGAAAPDQSRSPQT